MSTLNSSTFLLNYANNSIDRFNQNDVGRLFDNNSFYLLGEIEKHQNVIKDLKMSIIQNNNLIRKLGEVWNFCSSFNK